MIERRRFLGAVAGTGIAAALGSGPALAASPRGASPEPRPLVKPPRLRPGDTVGLINPASANFLQEEVDIVVESLAALDLKVKPGAHMMDRYGYLAGHDRDRASDVNAMFADPAVKAVLAVRGGWGSARILPHLDYDLIRRNPKILLGYSDVTALHLAVHARTGLVTFHGPVGVSSWTPFSVDHARRVLFDGEALTMANPVEESDTLARTEHRTRTIAPGRARGPLLGGNLTVLCHVLGSPYVPDWEGAILFVEDVDEEIYRVDRMLTQLALAGVLGRARGFVFGTCTECGPGQGYGSLTLEEVLADHVLPLKVPAWSGAVIGHVDKQFTLPVGLPVEADADAATIRMLEPAVV
jgi:muramoyltetrapeptide carboxypeptidase